MYNLDDIALFTGGRWLVRGTDSRIEHLLTDSRRLLFPATSLFFAIKTASRNGHQYIQRLYDKGLRSFVVSEAPDCDLLPGANILLVNDTVLALQRLAAEHRCRFQYPVIGITGSNGKTIVKEWLNQLLENDYRIVRSPRSYNSQIGVPLSVWQMSPADNLAIFEAGISEPGEMDVLGRYQTCHWLFTNLGAAHNEGFASMEQKLEEKWKLFNGADVVICRAGNPIVDEWAQLKAENGLRLFTWGRDEDCTVRVTDQLVLHYKQQSVQLQPAFTDEASVENLLHCCACLLYLGVSIHSLNERIRQLRPVAMRLELKEGINNCSVINDSYSTDLSSLDIALDFLFRQQQHVRKTVILSDIPQSGLAPGELYGQVADLLQHYQVNRLIAIGAVTAGFEVVFKSRRLEYQHFFSTENFISRFDELLFGDETILVKGARSFGFEAISSLLEKQEHQTVLEVDLNALLHNLRQYQQLLKPGTRLMAMVKAFSYGTGSFEVANLLQYHGVDYLAVAYTDEGLALRRGGIHLPIMVMNAAPPDFATLVEYNLEPVIYSLAMYRQLDRFARQEGLTQVPVHIELETGMNRLGFSGNEFDTLLNLLPASVFKVQSVFSHLAASEDPAMDAFTAEQVAVFRENADAIAALLPYPFIRHMENTAAITRLPGWQFDMVRPGIGLYGVPSGPPGQVQLKPVSTLKTTIAQIKYLQPGETVGYNRKGVITRPSAIATVRIGYADGYPRSLGNGRGSMLVNGRLAPVTGSVCMDMTMIDITGISGVDENSVVTVFGAGLPVEVVAGWAGGIAYELLTGISQRVKRIYYQD
ncbi:MAG: bifunctional UDP-N-acetylmuramoyl-tripeptide:D-alanyl-D-alanine ligase/alanine racemase [Flavihumibacter sp.]